MWLAYIFCAILLLTGIIGFCPLYTLFKFSAKKNYNKSRTSHKDDPRGSSLLNIS
jgi:hypothetical protein